MKNIRPRSLRPPSILGRLPWKVGLIRDKGHRVNLIDFLLTLGPTAQMESEAPRTASDPAALIKMGNYCAFLGNHDYIARE
ncbi:hypothetical protein D4R89_07690 [bacterium]|nr:MAG: hypothetical protein D4R89_07690 [bacterium]